MPKLPDKSNRSQSVGSITDTDGRSYHADPQPDGKLAIRTSDRGTFKDCRRQWHYASPMRMNLEPEAMNENFVFGTAIHKGFEVYYDPARASMPKDVREALAIDAFIEEMKPFKNAYLDQDFKMSYEEYLDLGRGMLDYYFHKAPFAKTEIDELEVVAVELEFEVTIGYATCSYTEVDSFDENGDPVVGEIEQWYFTPYSRDGKHNGIGLLDSEEHRKLWFNRQVRQMRSIGVAEEDIKQVVYQGRIDILWKDKRTGRYIIGDHKTASQLTETFYLSLDTQVSSYAWALTCLGYDITRIVYNELQKNYPKPPKINKDGSISVDKRQATTAELVLEAFGMSLTDYISSKTTGVAKYDDFIEWLFENEKEFVRRTPVSRNKQELAIQGQYILDETALMIEQPAIFPTDSKFTCNFCPFRGPCLAANEGGDDQIMLDFGPYQPRKPRHWR